jgi:DNA-binding response OmpR family regulator
VEDDQPTAWALNQALSSHHYVVTIATDGQIGLELAQAFTYDLLLLDVIVPKINGSSCVGSYAHNERLS